MKFFATFALWFECFKFLIVEARDEASLVVMGEEAYMVGGIGQSSVEVTMMMIMLVMLMRMIMMRVIMRVIFNWKVLNSIEETWSEGPELPEVAARYVFQFDDANDDDAIITIMMSIVMIVILQVMRSINW